MYRFMMGYAPDWAWDVYCWTINDRQARTRYPNLRRYLAFRRELRAAMWGGK